MNSYLLLRDNLQKGPYSIEEIKTEQLKPLDLIWIEGKSTAWQYPTEIGELKDLVDYSVCKSEKKSGRNLKAKKVYISLPAGTYRKYDEEIKNNVTYKEETPQLETHYEQSLDDLKDQYMNRYYERKTSLKSFKFNSQVSWFFVVAAILIGGAVIIKKIVESFDENSLMVEQTTVAQPFYDIPDASIAPAETTTSIGAQNAVSKEIFPDTIQSKPKKAKPKSLNRSVSISSNDYKVGVFGGISDLKLAVHNNSAFNLDKVNVNVAFLKPNGEVVESTAHTLTSIAPNKTKLITIPSSKRGVKVKYHITKIQSREHKAALKESSF